ncbi:MAG: DUF3090 family protein [Acidimicrobiales bacterium]|nr:DUF3090 family protein [Acidimicrobiales bacterium]
MNMPSPYDVINADHFTAGALGEPGQRVFYLQCRGDGVLVSLRCEKQQVGALGESFARVLQELPERTLGPVPTDLELALPVEAAFTVGGLGLGYDADHDRLLLLIEEFVPAEEPDDAPEAAAARWVLTREQVHAFVARAEDLLRGGRPLCPLCGRPIDTEGHTCPKTNGHRPH